MKILIIFTGGTIGSTTCGGVTAPDRTAIDTLLNSCISEQFDANRHMHPQVGSDLWYDILAPYYILSEELNAAHLNLLTQSIADNLHKDYDGIIVTHGSDTLPYTAALLDAMFSDSPVPIVLVCSNYPLDDPRTNGYVNFSAAISLIRKTTDGGVYVTYRNDPQTSDNPAVIHRGGALLRHAEASGDLHSAKTPDCSPSGRVVLCDRPGILLLDCAPGVLYPAVPARTNAVILMPYHSGTLPVNDPALRAVCTSCRNRGIPMFLPAAGCETRYAGSEAFGSLGIASVPLTGPALYARLWIEISCGRTPVRI